MDPRFSPATIRAASTVGFTASAALLGGGFALSLGTVPTMVQSPKGFLRKQWRSTYDTGISLGPRAAALSFILLSYAAYAKHHTNPDSTAWQGLIIAALGTISIVPFTMLFLVPESEKLLAESANPGEEGGMSEAELKATITKWGNINGFRCILPALANLIGLYLALE